VEEFKGELLHGEEDDALASDPRSEGEYEPSLPEEGSSPKKRKAGSTEEPRS